MIEMLYVLLLEIILIACIGCRHIPADDDHQLAIELARTAAQINYTLCTELVFPAHVEDIYREHRILLSHIIAQAPETPFAVTMSRMAGNNLQELFQQVKPEIDIVCSSQDVQCLFQNVYQQVQQKAPLNKRMELWLEFVTKFTEIKNRMRAHQLSSIWFPAQPNKSNEKNFIIKNAHLLLDKRQKRYLKADTVITFLPFAMIAKHDPESFCQFMQVR